MKNIQAVIYDLDGTIIDTEKLHEDGWVHALAPHGITPTKDMLLYQKGRSGDVAAKYMLPENMHTLVDQVREAKAAYVMEHLGEVPILGNFEQAYEGLKANGIPVGICTSARSDFIAAVTNLAALRELTETTVCKGMYKKGKPDSEPLLVTLEKLGRLSPQEAIYVGDAQSDYQMAVNTEVSFLYFCSGEHDPKIPMDVPKTNDHREI
ncbi:HAD hydrolase-like protein, partial [Candidatus Woesearchaeota archaeon]|nr:HAD hydrolase-like protein [Candidatus Woesearchaeota archaeon]